MPHLPRGDYKIVIRPTGGIKISEHGVVNLTAAVQDAAGIPLEEREEDIICPNNYQSILIASTPDQEHANKYQAIARIKVQDKFYETNAYETAPDMTAKGVIRGIPLEEGPRDITAAVVTTKNPTAIAAKRLSNTTTVIVLFEGHKVPTFVRYRAALLRCSLYRKQVDFCRQCNRLGHRGDVCPNPDNKLCAGCGTPNPDEGHRCEPKCQLCGTALEIKNKVKHDIEISIDPSILIPFWLQETGDTTQIPIHVQVYNQATHFSRPETYFSRPEI
ncbi:hypothetical protein HPB52_014518 [Rhipicephalus sanguineus]|uniref:CCHC-type domain-containing protein n=1 Tax=Rhipicephalus sanguineus TaxID=34632 RepID=A0A9D4T3T8_RHISA|nr:hypothetical protein HPB52_014518 [Rhipicephalus sanguineus]